jgi:hypothetical protein
MSKSSVRRGFAAFILALGVAGSLALAAPAAAEDDRPSPPDLEHAELLCKLFGGRYYHFGGSTYSCTFRTFEIVCHNGECSIAPPFGVPLLRDECEVAGGRYGELSRTAFACELREGVLALDCSEDREQPGCAVGWLPANE